jgi:hypothetical protein
VILGKSTHLYKVGLLGFGLAKIIQGTNNTDSNYLCARDEKEVIFP